MKRRTLSLLLATALVGSCSENPGSRPGGGETPSSADADAVPGDGGEASSPPPGEAPEGMVWIPGGTFRRGGDAGEEGGTSFSHQSAYPIHEVHVDGFWIDETEVTNRQFQEFVEATGYETFAERPLPEETVREMKEDARRHLARLELLADRATGEEREEILATMAHIRESTRDLHLAGSMIFAIPTDELADPQDISEWWRLDSAASWRTPGGAGTTLEGLEDHPVVNVTFDDAAAYAKWAGKRLPTEAEWEKAARGGLDHEPYAWGSEMFPKGEETWMANIWQGEWPQENTEKDGHYATAPVKSFPPNAYGLYDVAGNVWEIVADLYHPEAYRMPSATVPNSTGPPPEVAIPPGTQMIDYVTKGGSFLCSDQWCKGYQPGSRQYIDNQSPSNHTGFRCVRDAR